MYLYTRIGCLERNYREINEAAAQQPRDSVRIVHDERAHVTYSHHRLDDAVDILHTGATGARRSDNSSSPDLTMIYLGCVRVT